MSPSPLPSDVTTADQDLDEVLRYRIDTTLYTNEALFRACYLFTDRCFLFLQQTDPETVTVEFRKRLASINLLDLVGSFANELINQRVRADLARETQSIRELIVAHAFGEADFSEPSS